jgi:hypothetical protein
MTRRTFAPTAWRSPEPLLVELTDRWGGRSHLTERAAVRLPLVVLDLVEALPARGCGGIEGVTRVLTPVMAASRAVAVEADPGTPTGEDAHAATVVSRRRASPSRLDLCQVVVFRVAWTLADLAGRSVPGPDEVAEALGMRLQRAAA